MDIVGLSLGFLVVSLTIFWLFYLRTNRIIEKVTDRSTAAAMKIFASIERRMGTIQSRGDSLSYRDPISPIVKEVIWAVCVTYNRRSVLEQTLLSLRRHDPEIKILVVDNGSTDGTREWLARSLDAGLVQKTILNQHKEVPQWQKAFAMHQAIGLLSLEAYTHLLLLDDDIEITAPFREIALGVLQEFGATHNIKLVNLHSDTLQDSIHLTVDTVDRNGTTVPLKRTFNGACLFMPLTFFEEYGLPPIREGISVASVEDWYYSRLMEHSGAPANDRPANDRPANDRPANDRPAVAAAFNFSRHLGATQSWRAESEAIS